MGDSHQVAPRYPSPEPKALSSLCRRGAANGQSASSHHECMDRVFRGEGGGETGLRKQLYSASARISGSTAITFNATFSTTPDIPPPPPKKKPHAERFRHRFSPNQSDFPTLHFIPRQHRPHDRRRRRREPLVVPVVPPHFLPFPSRNPEGVRTLPVLTRITRAGSYKRELLREGKKGEPLPSALVRTRAIASVPTVRT